MATHAPQSSLLEARLQLDVLHDCSDNTSVSAITIERAFSVDIGGHPVLRKSCHPCANRPDPHAFHFLDHNACGQCNLDTGQLFTIEQIKPSSFSPFAATPVARSRLFISFRKSSLAFAAGRKSSVQKIHCFASGVASGTAHQSQCVFSYFGHDGGAGQWPARTTHWCGLTLLPRPAIGDATGILSPGFFAGYHHESAGCGRVQPRQVTSRCSSARPYTKLSICHLLFGSDTETGDVRPPSHSSRMRLRPDLHCCCRQCPQRSQKEGLLVDSYESRPRASQPRGTHGLVPRNCDAQALPKHRRIGLHAIDRTAHAHQTAVVSDELSKKTFHVISCGSATNLPDGLLLKRTPICDVFYPQEREKGSRA